MSEAITVYGESAMSPYSGRMNGGTYPAIISALSAEGKMPSLTKAGYYSSSTPLANHYVFGGSFYQYLADTYGPDKFPILFEYTGGSLFSYLNPLYSNLSLDKAYQDAYGKPLQVLWSEWQATRLPKSSVFPISQSPNEATISPSSAIMMAPFITSVIPGIKPVPSAVLAPTG
jgi:hypothetical protein